MAIVYQATNSVNGKRYIGATSKSVKERRDAHVHKMKEGDGSRFHAAIRKYGIGVFIWETLATCRSIEVAYQVEVSLISSSRPEYNVSAGGLGGMAGIPASNRKSVICLEDGALFPSIKLAAKHYGVGMGSISQACSGVLHTIKGRHFRYSTTALSDDDRAAMVKGAVERKIRDRRRGRPPSIAIPASSIDRLGRSKAGPLSRVRKVECVDTGIVYESAQAAACACDVSVSALREMCLGRRWRKTVGGLKFRYITEPDNGLG